MQDYRVDIMVLMIKELQMLRNLVLYIDNEYRSASDREFMDFFIHEDTLYFELPKGDFKYQEILQSKDFMKMFIDVEE